MIQKNFSDFLYIFACGTKGINPTLKHEINTNSLYKYGISQGVWNIIFASLLKLYETDDVHIDEAQFQKLNNLFLQSVTQNIRRQAVVNKAITMLESNGVRCCLLKGEALSVLYNEPSCRISCDADFYIGASKEGIVGELMREQGWRVEERPKQSHHAMATHPIGGLIEFHLSFHDDIFEDVWFNNITEFKEPYREIITANGYKYNTLGYTDGLIFVTMHFIKHFLEAGAGVRQLMDMLLYMKQYKEHIEWNRFNCILAYLKYDKFIYLCTRIGIKYLLFDEIDFMNVNKIECDDKQCDLILEDMFNGGVFGHDAKLRIGFNYAYTEARFSRFKKESYKKYFYKWRMPGIKNFFPSLYIMRNQFVYLNKYPVLLPIAWVQKWLKWMCRFNKDKRQLDVGLNNKCIEERMNLIRELDMV